MRMCVPYYVSSKFDPFLKKQKHCRVFNDTISRLLNSGSFPILVIGFAISVVEPSTRTKLKKVNTVSKNIRFIRTCLFFKYWRMLCHEQYLLIILDAISIRKTPKWRCYNVYPYQLVRFLSRGDTSTINVVVTHNVVSTSTLEQH
jgi:hypothetical protein